MTKKRGRPAFPQKHRTLNVYLPNDLHDRLQVQAHRLRMSRSALIRRYVETMLEDDEIVNEAVDARHEEMYGR